MWGALFQAELRRRAHDGKLHRLRVAWTAALFGVLLGLYAAAVLSLDIEVETMGRWLLWQLRDGEVLIGAVVAPGLGGLAVLEDRVAGRLDLERMTRMGAGQRWVERMGAGLWGLVGLAVASGPALACCAMLGGVDPWAVVHTVLGSVFSICLLGAVGAVFALVTDRLLWAWLGSLTWGWLVLLGLPALAAALSQARSASYLEFSALDLLWRGMWPDRSMAMEAARLSPVWAGELGAVPADAQAYLIGTALLVLVVVRGAVALRAHADGRGHGVWGSLLALLGLCGGAALVWADVGPLEVSWGLIQCGAAWLGLDLGVFCLGLGRSRRHRTAWWPWCLPWLRRELRSRAYGGVGLVGWWLGGAWGLLLLQLWWATPTSSTRLDVIGVDASAMVLGLALVVIAGVSSALSDHVGGEIIAATHSGPRRLIASRMAGMALRTMPLLLLGAAATDPRLMLWVPGFWAMATACCLAAGWAVRSPGLAWGLALGGAFAFAVGAGQSTLWGDGSLEMLAWVAPPLAQGRQSALSLVGSGAAYLALAGLCVGLIRWRLRGWLARGHRA